MDIKRLHVALKLSTFIIGLLVLAISSSGCASKETRGADIGQRFDEKEYDRLIKKNTQHTQQYEGFYNKFELYATFIKSEVQTALLQKKSDTFQWDAKRAQIEREKMFQENSTQTKFALSFYTPSTRLNDLHKSNSVWKIYLESGGQRYDGHVTRRNGKFEEFQGFFPYHTRWSIAYDVSFNVPLSAVEKAPATFILSGIPGTAKLQFEREE